MKSPRDPAAMSPEDRLAEVASIVACGYGRLTAARSGTTPEPELGDSTGEPENGLAVLDGTEPSCDRAVNSREKGSAA